MCVCVLYSFLSSISLLLLSGSLSYVLNSVVMSLALFVCVCVCVCVCVAIPFFALFLRFFCQVLFLIS